MTKTRVFNAALLTTAYAGNQSLPIPIAGGKPVLLINYTKGTETSMEVQLEVTSDPDHSDPANIDYFVPSDKAAASLAEIFTVAATGKYRLQVGDIAGIGALDLDETHIRLSVKATGATTGTVTIDLLSNPEPFRSLSRS